jgi:Flp pilus assembly protein TadB
VAGRSELRDDLVGGAVAAASVIVGIVIWRLGLLPEWAAWLIAVGLGLSVNFLWFRAARRRRARQTPTAT